MIAPSARTRQTRFGLTPRTRPHRFGPTAAMEKPAGEAQKTIRVFAASSFLNDLGSDMIYPVWPMFVTEALKADMAALGFLDGLGDALVSLSQAGSGYLSDRLKKRKVFIWAGYLCGALSRLGYAAAAVWPHLVPSRVLDRSGKMRNPPRDAEVADISTPSNRGRNFGLLRAMDNLEPSAAFSSPSCSSTPSATGFFSLWPPFPLSSASCSSFFS